jgi:GNAT superfamily N-acetyltransferase
MTDAIQLRSGTPADVAACGRICFDGFKTFNDQHGFPPDFPSVEAASGLMTMLFTHPGVFGVVAESNGRVVGSNFLWEAEPVMGVGPITVEPTGQGRSVGKRLMQRVLERARERNAASVRLCQAAFNTRSMSLYTKLGFDVREPLACMQGEPMRDPGAVPGHRVRPATGDDVEDCCELARRVHGHERRAELDFGIAQGTARVVEHGGRVVGYATGIGFFAHAVALENAGLVALIAGAEQITGPGLLLPSRNGEVFRWCLTQGLKVVQPMTLMSTGLYNEPRGAFLPSILF